MFWVFLGFSGGYSRGVFRFGFLGAQGVLKNGSKRRVFNVFSVFFDAWQMKGKSQEAKRRGAMI